MTAGTPQTTDGAQKQMVSELALRADSCRAQGLYDESEMLFRRALDLAEQYSPLMNSERFVDGALRHPLFFRIIPTR